MQIDIDFEVFKALTARRTSESHTYNEVLRDLLKLPADKIEIIPASPEPQGGRLIGGRLLPNGTLLRAKYKGSYYNASIENNRWISEDGSCFDSASAAARGITNNSVNGLTFWEAKRPSDTDWTILKSIPKRVRKAK